ncbi:MAG TPA: EI24 domain-containing protein [Gemmatimonadales bacterium]|nr:EI24 domain-containing protein [Gemmatimonadales bacterium]
MSPLFDAFWRAVAYCVHPRVVLLSIAPLVLMAALTFGLAWLFWDAALDAVNATIASWEVLTTFVHWLDGVGFSGLRGAIAPLVVVFLSTPVIVVVALLFVATLMTPALVRLVAQRRFPALRRAHGGSFAGGVAASLGATLFALAALVLSIPLWFIPPLALVIPPLIWGWLAYKVMVYDVLAEHASVEERRALVARHRGPLLLIGFVSGYLGAAPTLVWASGFVFLVLWPVLLPLAIWIYTLVFAFSALWFAHYALQALHVLRAEGMTIDLEPAAPAPPAGTPPPSRLPPPP